MAKTSIVRFLADPLKDSRLERRLPVLLLATFLLALGNTTAQEPEAPSPMSLFPSPLANALSEVVEPIAPSAVPELAKSTDAPAICVDCAELAPADDDEPKFTYGYDKGFFIKPTDTKKHPFSMTVNGRMQLRHTLFRRDLKTWTDNAGVTRPVSNRNDFELERGRIHVAGHLLDPKLEYFVRIDFDTDENNRLDALDFWISYQFSERLTLYAGKDRVPGSRDWISQAWTSRFADRTQATTFFRPDRSMGVWVQGKLTETLHYKAMIANAFAGTDLNSEQIDDRFAYAGSMWWDLIGDYGEGYSDLEWHEEPAVRVGHSFTQASSLGTTGSATPLAELTFVRLTDGTRLIEKGALAPGVTIHEFEILLYTIDLSGKYRGFSADGEYFCRWLTGFDANGPLPLSSIYDHGFFLEGGYFVIPKRLELNARTSQIFGMFGHGAEYASGLNWFFKRKATHSFKLTFDVTWLDHNPINNAGSNYRVGDTGLMFRTQFQAGF